MDLPFVYSFANSEEIVHAVVQSDVGQSKRSGLHGVVLVPEKHVTVHWLRRTSSNASMISQLYARALTYAVRYKSLNEIPC